MELYHINYRQLILLITLLSFSVFTSCKRDEKITPVESVNLYSSAKFHLSVKSNNSIIYLDSLNNINQAGNTYSVHNINLYICNITLKNATGVSYYSKDVFYLDPFINNDSSFDLDSITKGSYTEIDFSIGIDSIRNIDYGLNSSMNNINMAWPTAMGGGYHFLKIEGHYLDASNNTSGFAIHLGKNENLVHVKITKNITQINNNHDYSLIFDINEVFSNPYLYNLNTDANYTMSDSTAMDNIKTNMKDAFTIIQNN